MDIANLVRTRDLYQERYDKRAHIELLQIVLLAEIAIRIEGVRAELDYLNQTIKKEKK